MNNEQLIELAVLVGALLQMAKAIPQAPKFTAWFPVLSVFLGIGIAFAAQIGDPIISGIMIGLSASGGYSFLKVKTSSTKENNS